MVLPYNWNLLIISACVFIFFAFLLKMSSVFLYPRNIQIFFHLRFLPIHSDACFSDFKWNIFFKCSFFNEDLLFWVHQNVLLKASTGTSNENNFLHHICDAKVTLHPLPIHSHGHTLILNKTGNFQCMFCLHYTVLHILTISECFYLFSIYKKS